MIFDHVCCTMYVHLIFLPVCNLYILYGFCALMCTCIIFCGLCIPITLQLHQVPTDYAWKIILHRSCWGELFGLGNNVDICIQHLPPTPTTCPKPILHGSWRHLGDSPMKGCSVLEEPERNCCLPATWETSSFLDEMNIMNHKSTCWPERPGNRARENEMFEWLESNAAFFACTLEVTATLGVALLE